MYSEDLRWRIVSLIHIYNLDTGFLSELFGPNVRSIQRWYKMFKSKGIVMENSPRNTTSRWPPHVVARVEQYVKTHPTFYLEELQAFLKQEFPTLRNTSLPTICRALNFDMQLT